MLEVVLPLFNPRHIGGCARPLPGRSGGHRLSPQDRALRSSGPDPRRESPDAARATRDDADRDRRLAARIDDLIDHLERPRETTVLRVLESKAAAGEVAIAVTSGGDAVCGGAAFSKHLSIERLFRDVTAIATSPAAALLSSTRSTVVSAAARDDR